MALDGAMEHGAKTRRGRDALALERLNFSSGYKPMSDTLKTQVLEDTIERTKARASCQIRRGLVGRSQPAASRIARSRWK